MTRLAALGDVGTCCMVSSSEALSTLARPDLLPGCTLARRTLTCNVASLEHVKKQRMLYRSLSWYAQHNAHVNMLAICITELSMGVTARVLVHLDSGEIEEVST